MFPVYNISCSEATRKSWPELVGKPGSEAKATIERDLPGVTAVGNIRDLNLCCNRVWVNVNNDPQRNVATVPRVG
ncbi:hypothetical protein MKW98_006237 [Papaver atlanticum]|uniref:Uncharacterized protein n=1 Tax=Papaver atlanticum TaxID=357466 RepID=A0AAD4TGJ0_9MAGN|nr:hypothetical protein MKW98_006237 [Papaver atlanticum]